MNQIKAFRYSLLSVLCVISWFVMIFRIFKLRYTESEIAMFSWTCWTTIVTGIIGGIVLILVDIIKVKKLRSSFVYNLFATMNIMIGCLGMTLHNNPNRPTPYVIAASLVLGLIMHRNIYARRKYLAA